jgi:hypothetical protein
VAAVSLVPKHTALDKAKAEREAAVVGLEQAQAAFNVRNHGTGATWVPGHSLWSAVPCWQGWDS